MPGPTSEVWHLKSGDDFWIISSCINSLRKYGRLALRACQGDLREIGGSMARKKKLEISQIWHVDFERRGSRRSDDDRRCYQIISRLVRGEKNYWVGLDTTANPPMWASFAVFDDYGREVEPDKAISRSLSKRCLHECFFKLRNLRENMAEGRDGKGKSKKVKVKSVDQRPGFPLSRE
jgi:hypothetical protein